MDILDNDTHERQKELKKYNGRVAAARIIMFCIIGVMLLVAIYTSQGALSAGSDGSDFITIVAMASLLLIITLMTIPLPRAFMVILTIFSIYCSWGFLWRCG